MTYILCSTLCCDHAWRWCLPSSRHRDPLARTAETPTYYGTSFTTSACRRLRAGSSSLPAWASNPNSASISAGGAAVPPCLGVESIKGYAVIKDKVGPGQILVVPTARITGIESADLQAPESENYFSDAWNSRGLVSSLLGVSLGDRFISVAINSQYGRSQNQLHLHVDCLAPAAYDQISKQSLGRNKGEVFTMYVKGRAYKALYLAGKDVPQDNPFRAARHLDRGDTSTMGAHTLVLLKVPLAENDASFLLLDGTGGTTRERSANGEDLQDHRCTIAKRAL